MRILTLFDPPEARQIAVWYDPADPARSVTEPELQAERHGWMPYLLGLLVVGLIVVAVRFIRKLFMRPLDADPV